MALQSLSVSLKVREILCREEGDGWGSAEPYLWTVFFKIDGSTVAINDDLTFTGRAWVQGKPGSHGNLPNHDVDPGELIPVPAIIGEWATTLVPIPSPSSLEPLRKTIPGIVGVATVLMEEDNVSDGGAEAAHGALNAAVQTALDEFLANNNLIDLLFVTPEDFGLVLDKTEESITSAVKDHQSLFENIWSGLNADDVIGHTVFTFVHTDLQEHPFIAFFDRWKSEGDWEIRGHVTSAPLCPFEMAGQFGELKESAPALDALRTFRASQGELLRGFPAWNRVLSEHGADLVYAVLKEPSLRSELRALLEGAVEAGASPDRVISPVHLRPAERLLAGLAKYGSRRAVLNARRWLDMLRLARGRTLREVLQLLRDNPPSRRKATFQRGD